MGGTALLEVRLLGEPEAQVDGKPIDVDTRKAIAVLAYLAVEGPTTRDTLTALLWPEAPPDRARATLRRTLSALRTGVGRDHLESDRDRVVLTGSLRLDVRDFEDELTATHGHDHEPRDVCHECIPHLARVADLYRGHFLEGFGVGDAPEFEDWARTAGEAFRLRAGEALNRLGMAMAASGDYAAAISAVARWLELDPLHEPAHRLLMLLNAWAGDRPAAMSAYRSFVALLDRELGVPPLEETSELYEAILDEDLPPAPGVRRRPRAHIEVGAPATSSLLDRQAELGLLLGALSESAKTGLFVAIMGDSWMGKSRLLEELVAAAGSKNRSVLMGRASRVEQVVPYAAITPVIRQSLARMVEAGLDLPGWVSEELGRIVPSLSGGRGGLRADPLGDLRFLEAVFQLLELVTSIRPIVITIDDGQWLDAASMRLIGYLTSRIAPLPLLLVVALRSDGIPPPDAADLASLASTVVRLDPLEPADIEGLVGKAQGEAIVRMTGGIPLLILEHLGQDPGAGKTPGVVRYIEDRLRGISDLARQVLAAAAVLGTARDAAVLRDTSGRSEDEVVHAVEELIASGLLRELPGAEGIGFALEPAEKLVYETTSLIRRRLLHKRAAAALEEMPRADEDGGIAAAIATHHQGSGSHKAARWFRRAGDLARDAYAQTEARMFYENAIALGGEDAGELHLALGELAMAAGEYERAMVELRSAASQTEAETLSIVEHRIGEVNRLLGRFAPAEESFARAESHHPALTSLYADWALLHHRLGSRREALAMAEKALESAEDGSQNERSRAHNIVAIVQADAARAREHIDTALELARDAETERMAALNTKARLLAQSGEADQAIDLVSEAVELAAATGHRHREAALRNHLADLHHRAGNFELAKEALTGAVTIFADIDTEAREPEVWLLSHW